MKAALGFTRAMDIVMAMGFFLCGYVCDFHCQNF